MRTSHFRIRVTERHVMVEKRSPWTPILTFLGTFVFGVILMLVLPGKHGQPPLLLTAVHSDGSTVVGILLFVGIFSGFLSYGSLKLSRAEFLHCDSGHLHIGRKGFGRAWLRGSYPRGAVNRLRWGFLALDRHTAVRSLMFEVGGSQEHTLEGLALSEADAILRSCKDFGYDVFRDVAEPMILDIEKRGWLINPWRPDASEVHPKEQ